jgi:hypothetical protein
MQPKLSIPITQPVLTKGALSEEFSFQALVSTSWKGGLFSLVTEAGKTHFLRANSNEGALSVVFLFQAFVSGGSFFGYLSRQNHFSWSYFNEGTITLR